MNHVAGMQALDTYHKSKVELIQALAASGFETNTEETRVLMLQWIVGRNPKYAGALGTRGATVVVRQKHKHSCITVTVSILAQFAGVVFHSKQI